MTYGVIFDQDVVSNFSLLVIIAMELFRLRTIAVINASSTKITQ